jgi:hypothetical protein
VIAWTTPTHELQFEALSFLGFEGVATIPGGTNDGPALAVVGTRLYAAFRGETTHNVYYSADTAGKLYGGTWTAEHTVPGALTPYNPALAVTGPTLYAASTGNQASSTVNASLGYSASDPPRS